MRRRWHRAGAAMLLLLLIPLGNAAATEDEAEVSLDDAHDAPYVYIVTPTTGQSYDAGGKSLTVHAVGHSVARITFTLALADQTLEWACDGEDAQYTFPFTTPQTGSATLTVRGYTNAEDVQPVATQSVQMISPKE